MDLSACHSSVSGHCEPAECRGRCALDVIDELLSLRDGPTGAEMDLLLDLRWKLGKQEDAEGALRIFCELRLRMEQRHYLAFFRIRRWLENHLLAAVRICPAAEPHLVPVKLDHYCVEPIRRVCLCSALGRGAVLIAPRLEFQYRVARPVSPVVAVAEVGFATLDSMAAQFSE